MPTVPVVKPSDILTPGVGQPAQLQGTRYTSRNIDTGPAVEEGTGRLDQAIENLGKVAVRIRNEDAVFSARDRLTQARREFLLRSRGQADSPFNWTGERSTGILKAIQETHEEVGSEFMDGLSAPALEVFHDEWGRDSLDAESEASKLQATRRREWQDGVLNDELEDAVGIGIRNAGVHEDLVMRGFEKGVDSIRLHSIVNGVSDADTETKLKDWSSAYWANVINAASQTNPTASAAYLTTYGEVLGAKHYAQALSALKPMLQLDQGQKRTDKIIGDAVDPVTGAVDWEQANEMARSVTDPVLRAEVERQISTRRERDAAAKTMNNAQRREFDWGVLNSILDVDNPAEIRVADAEKIVKSQSDPGTRDAMQKRLDQAVRGRDIVTDPTSYERLNNLFLRAAVTGDITNVRPENLSLADWSASINPNDLKRFYTWQRDLLDPTKRKQAELAGQSASAAANAMVKRLGISEKSEAGRQRGDSVRYAYQLALEDALRRKQEREGVTAKLTATEQAEVDRAFIQTRYEETAIWFHDQEPLSNYIPFEEWDDVASGVRESGWPVTPETMLLFSEFQREQQGKSPRITRKEQAKLRARLEELGIREVK